jgi:hypothetical protein
MQADGMRGPQSVSADPEVTPISPICFDSKPFGKVVSTETKQIKVNVILASASVGTFAVNMALRVGG